MHLRLSNHKLSFHLIFTPADAKQRKIRGCFAHKYTESSLHHAFLTIKQIILMNWNIHKPNYFSIDNGLKDH